MMNEYLEVIVKNGYELLIQKSGFPYYVKGNIRFIVNTHTLTGGYIVPVITGFGNFHQIVVGERITTLEELNAFIIFNQLEHSA